MTTQVPSSMTAEGVTAAQITALQGRATALESGTGRQIQCVTFETSAVATGTTIIPADDTIPQNTEGDQYMSLTVTPTSAASKLKIEVTMVLTHSVGTTGIGVALFQDSTASALAGVMQQVPSAGGVVTVQFNHIMAAGTTSPTTFKVRAGGGAAGTVTFNGSAGGRLFGGVMASSIVITEIGG